MQNLCDMEITPRDFSNISFYIKELCGLDLQEEKMYLVRQRLQPLVVEMGCESFSQFYLRLQVADCVLREKVVEAMTTNETYFFRDIHPWDSLVRYVLPELAAVYLQRRELTGPLPFSKVNIWCAASSTGQEPYTIAMCIHEFCNRLPDANITPGDFRIIATDIDSAALSKASGGLYRRQEVERGVNPQRLERYFIPDGQHHYRIRDSLRQIVDFRKQNLLQDFSTLGMFDLIFCRNVLIYFDYKARKDIVCRMGGCLLAQGMLVLGASENLHEVCAEFEARKYADSMFHKKHSVAGRSVR